MSTQIPDILIPGNNSQKNKRGLKVKETQNLEGILALGVSMEDAIPQVSWWQESFESEGNSSQKPIKTYPEVSLEDSNSGNLLPLKPSSEPLENEERDTPALQHSGDGGNMDIGAIFFFGLYLAGWVLKLILGFLGVAAIALAVVLVVWYQGYWYLSPVFLAAGVLLTSPLWLNRAYEYANGYTSYYISHVWARILLILGSVFLIEALVFDNPQLPIPQISAIYIDIGVVFMFFSMLLFFRSSR